MREILSAERRRLLQQYVKFCCVGLSGLAVDMILLYSMASPSMFGWNVALSKVIAAETAILNNFVWNSRWTFQKKSGEACRGGFAAFIKFNLVCSSGLLLSVGLLHTALIFTSNLLLANFICVVLVSGWNFILTSGYVFQNNLLNSVNKAKCPSRKIIRVE